MPSARVRAGTPRKLKPEVLAEKLATMQYLNEKMKKLKIEYETLRDAITPHLSEQTVFVAESGEKMYAIRVQAEDIIFDLDALAELVDEETFAKVIDVKVNRDELRKAVMREEISPDVLAQVATTKPKAASVRFSTHPAKDNDEMKVSFADEG